MASQTHSSGSTVAQNRKARANYAIEEEIEAGLVLTGTEVKSLRAGKAQINDAFASPKGDELWLLNAAIAPYVGGNRFNHEERRPRKLLLHKRQVNKLIGRLKVKGVSLVPLALYFNSRGIAKVMLGLGTGKKEYEKRDTIKKRDWQRDKARIMREKK
jgi:SsrA-binding protein